MTILSSTSRVPLGTTGRTGEKCPESGVWQAIANPGGEIPLSKGETFPPHNNQAVTWKLVRYA